MGRDGMGWEPPSRAGRGETTRGETGSDETRRDVSFDGVTINRGGDRESVHASVLSSSSSYSCADRPARTALATLDRALPSAYRPMCAR